MLRAVIRQVYPVTLIALLVFAIVGVLVIRVNYIDWAKVGSDSMLPDFHIGEILFINKRITNNHAYKPRYHDVIIFNHSNKYPMIKRVIGLPGDTVEIKNNTLIVNGVAATYERISTPKQHISRFTETQGDISTTVQFTTGASPSSRYVPLTRIKKGYIYVLGDNRNQSEDSRYFGPIAIDSVIGVVQRHY